MSPVSRNELPLPSAVGAILDSFVDAQQYSARATVDYVGNVGLSALTQAAPPLRTVKITFEKLDENNVPAPFVLEVPLLALVDIPVMNVSSATVRFGFDVVSVEQRKRESLAKKGAASAVDTIIGRFTSRGDAASTVLPIGLDVTLELERSAMPVGIERLIEVLELSASEKRSRR